MTRLTLVACATLALLSSPVPAQEAVDHLGLPGPIVLGGRDYHLVWSARPQPGYVKQEYLPRGAELETYDSMVLIEFLATDLPLPGVVSAQIAMIEERRAVDPVAGYGVLERPEAGEIVLDFLLSAPDATGAPIVEWNGYRYAPAALAGQAGSILFGLSERAYGQGPAGDFLSDLPGFKADRIADLLDAQMPRPR